MQIKERIERFNAFVNEGRIIRNKFHSYDEEGVECACLIGALGPEIDDTWLCPVEIMPRWMADLSVRIDDRVSIGHWDSIIKRYQQSLNKWIHFTPENWKSVEYKFLSWAIKTKLKLIESESDRSNVNVFLQWLDERIKSKTHTEDDEQKLREIRRSIDSSMELGSTTSRNFEHAQTMLLVQHATYGVMEEFVHQMAIGINTASYWDSVAASIFEIVEDEEIVGHIEKEV